MISATQCAAFAGLEPDDLILGVSVSSKHRSLLSSYLLNQHRGLSAVRNMIVADLRRFRELGARQRAADLLIVLRLFLTEHPEARCVQRRECEFRASGGLEGGSEPIDAMVEERERPSSWRGLIKETLEPSSIRRFDWETARRQLSISLMLAAAMAIAASVLHFALPLNVPHVNARNTFAGGRCEWPLEQSFSDTALEPPAFRWIADCASSPGNSDECLRWVRFRTRGGRGPGGPYLFRARSEGA